MVSWRIFVELGRGTEDTALISQNMLRDKDVSSSVHESKPVL